MDNVTKEKVGQIINSLEIEVVNIASKMDLKKQPIDNYSRTRDLINIGSVILWLKNCLRQDYSAEEIESKVKTFEEVVKDQRYTTAGNISQISYLANRLSTEMIDEKEIKQILQEITRLDDNKFYKVEQLKKASKENLPIVAKKISIEASKDAARMIKSLLNDEDYMERLKDSGYRIDEAFVNPEHHLTTSLHEQISNSFDIYSRLNRVLKQLNTRTK